VIGTPAAAAFSRIAGRFCSGTDRRLGGASRRLGGGRAIQNPPPSNSWGGAVRAGVISSHAVARLVSVAFLAAARRACHRGSLAAFSGSRAMRVAGGSDFAVLGLPEGAL
jgi:hypothetical protein